MFRFPVRFRFRRGGSTTIGLVGLTMILVTAGAEMDSCRIAVTRHKDQTISDAATMAAMLQLPRAESATAEVNKIIGLYKRLYGRDVRFQVGFFPANSTTPTQVRVDSAEDVPMLISNLMGAKTRPTAALAAGGTMIPNALMQGVVPLGVQYDTDFDLPAGSMASPNTIVLKIGNGDDKIAGNGYALDLPQGSGANDWRAWVKYGYEYRLAKGQTVNSKPGNMKGPIEEALINDLDSRLKRALLSPYTNDTFTSFHRGNPRIIVVPLVDWKGRTGASSQLEVMKFAAFFVDSYAQNSGEMTGHFVRYTTAANGQPGWDGVSISRSDLAPIDGTNDAGFYAAHFDL